MVFLYCLSASSSNLGAKSPAVKNYMSYIRSQSPTQFAAYIQIAALMSISTIMGGLLLLLYYNRTLTLGAFSS